MAVIGVDPSLTSIGYAYMLDGRLFVGSLIQREARGMQRLQHIATQIRRVSDGCSLMAIEGYAFGVAAAASRAHSLGEVGGIIKYSAWASGMNLLIVPPQNLKLFMLGRFKSPKGKKGEAKKQVKLAAEAHAERAFANTDQADAYSLLLMGQCFENKRLLPRSHTDTKRIALDGCDYIPAFR